MAGVALKRDRFERDASTDTFFATIQLYLYQTEHPNNTAEHLQQIANTTDTNTTLSRFRAWCDNGLRLVSTASAPRKELNNNNIYHMYNSDVEPGSNSSNYVKLNIY